MSVTVWIWKAPKGRFGSQAMVLLEVLEPLGDGKKLSHWSIRTEVLGQLAGSLPASLPFSLSPYYREVNRLLCYMFPP